MSHGSTCLSRRLQLPWDSGSMGEDDCDMHEIMSHDAHEPSGSHRWATLMAGLFTFVFGCSELPEPQWEREYIALAAEEPERVCAGTVDYMNRRAGELFEKLGTE